MAWRQSDVFIRTENFMNYALLIYIGPQAQAMRHDPQQHAAYFPPWMAYAHAIRDAGIHVGGAGLELPETATTVRIRDGQRDVQDGPFAETKEQLAGFFLIDVPDLDKALDWAARCPVLPGDVVEVRPCLRTS
jgi:hypothetical protein